MPEGSVWYSRGVPSKSNPTIRAEIPKGLRPLLWVYLCSEGTDMHFTSSSALEQKADICMLRPGKASEIFSGGFLTQLPIEGRIPCPTKGRKPSSWRGYFTSQPLFLPSTEVFCTTVTIRKRLSWLPGAADSDCMPGCGAVLSGWAGGCHLSTKPAFSNHVQQFHEWQSRLHLRWQPAVGKAVPQPFCSLLQHITHHKWP